MSVLVAKRAAVQYCPQGPAANQQTNGLALVWGWLNDREVRPERRCVLRNDVGHTIFVTSTHWDNEATGKFSAGETVAIRISVDNCLAPSQYSITPSVARAGSGADALDLREDFISIIVHGARVTGGILDIPHSIAITRQSSLVTK